MIWRLPRHQFDLSARGLIVGIVNVTPDSFSDGGAFYDPEAACIHGLHLLDEGADLLDLGAESTRPASIPVSSEEELERLLPVIRMLRARTNALLSIDTSKAVVAAAALGVGADIINDVSSLRDPLMAELVASHRAGLILMHMLGTPATMQDDVCYHDDDVLGTVSKFLLEKREAAIGSGVAPSSIILDPGLGFGKTASHNLALIRGIPTLAALGSPIMIGHSRKSFLGALNGQDDPGKRLAAGLAVTALARTAGARLFRVHEAASHRDALRLTEALL